jgi:hypothetical protein
MASVVSVSLRVVITAVILTTIIIELLRSALPGHELGAAEWTLASLIGVGLAILGDRLVRYVMKRVRK